MYTGRETEIEGKGERPTLRIMHLTGLTNEFTHGCHSLLTLSCTLQDYNIPYSCVHSSWRAGMHAPPGNTCILYV